MATETKSIGVLLTRSLSDYIQTELSKRYTLHKLWQIPQNSLPNFFTQHSDSIKAVVGNGVTGADSKLIDALPNLKIVASHSSGLDKIDLVKCKEKGIRVTYTPDPVTNEVADMAILLCLATARRICEADLFVRSGQWNYDFDFKLTTKFSGKSVGIVGLGRIGSAIAKRAEAFGCSVGYYSRSLKLDSKYKYYPTVLELAERSEILFLACAIAPETRHIVNREVIDALGRDGIIVNIGRGSLIDQDEMVSALVEGRLKGAGLDVLENEPEVPEQLVGLRSVVLSPHCAASTFETRKDLADLVIKNLEAYFADKPLLTPVI